MPRKKHDRRAAAAARKPPASLPPETRKTPARTRTGSVCVGPACLHLPHRRARIISRLTNVIILQILRHHHLQQESFIRFSLCVIGPLRHFDNVNVGWFSNVTLDDKFRQAYDDRHLTHPTPQTETPARSVPHQPIVAQDRLREETWLGSSSKRPA